MNLCECVPIPGLLAKPGEPEVMKSCFSFLLATSCCSHTGMYGYSLLVAQVLYDMWSLVWDR